jgi:hypothetical protein
MEATYTYWEVPEGGFIGFINQYSMENILPEKHLKQNFLEKRFYSKLML